MTLLISSSQWVPGKHLLATSHGTSVQILSEHQVTAHFNQEVIE